MALTSSQISSKLFKKSLGAGETIVSRQFFEEPKLGRDLVFSDQIWSQSNLIPNTAPSLAPGASAGVVQYFQLETLSHVSGSSNLSYFSSNLIDSIPFNYGDGTYNYQLYKNDGVTSIAFGDGDWIIDNTAGLLTFYGTLPSGVISSTPPKISFYKYVGNKGLGGDSGIGTILGVTAGDGLTGGGTQGFITLSVNLDNGLQFGGTNSDFLQVKGSTAIGVGIDGVYLLDNIPGDRNFQGSISIDGNLSVNGTVSYINTENLLVSDNIITLNGTYSGPAISYSGIEVNIGNGSYSKLLYQESVGLWIAGSSGSESSLITRAGTGLTKSGDTLSVDTIGFSSTLAGNGLTSNGGSLDVNIGNGLSISNDVIVIGGTLSQDTTINANDYNFTISGADNLIFTASTFDLMADGFISIDAGFGSMQIAADDDIDIISTNADISFTSNNFLINSTSSIITIADGRGLVYSSQPSNFVTHSLVTKSYVDSVVSGVGATNGLTEYSSGIVGLGGTFSQNTNLFGSGYDLNFIGFDEIMFTASVFDLLTSGLIDISAGEIDLSAQNNININSLIGDISLNASKNLIISVTSASVSTADGLGLVYVNDYSGTFVTNSLVTKKYVDDKFNQINSTPIYETKLSLATIGDNQPTGFTLSYVPNDYSRIQVFINGQNQILGNGVSSSVDCYFWNGVSSVSLNNLSVGNELYWNGIYSGFDLLTSDLINVVYEK